MQVNLTNQLFDRIGGTGFNDSINCSIGIENLIEFDFNITNKEIVEIQLDASQQLVKLYDDRLAFGVRNFTANAGFSYMYISNPPIFADIGDFDMDIANTTFLLDFDQTFGDDGVMDIVINSLELFVAPWRAKFDGISDISQVATSFISYVGNVLTNRLTSIVAYKGPEYAQIIVNKLIEIIPDEKHLPNSTLYIEGGIADSFAINPQYMSIPLDVTLQNSSDPFLAPNAVVFAPYENEGFEL